MYANNRGKHFGHSKAGSGQAGRSGGQLATPSLQVPGPHAGTTTSAHPGGAVPFLPALDCFVEQTMDIYTGNATVPPPGANRRQQNVACLIAGTALEGTRQRTNTGFGYTHIILCDPTIEIRDGYTGAAAAPTVAAEDLLNIPAGTPTKNYWAVVLSQIVVLPSVGRKKLILADRRGPVGDWTVLV